MSKITLQWTNEKRKVSELIPADYNPRKISEVERKDLMESIKEFDQVVPVVINTDGKLIGGHQRCKLYLDLGIDEVEVRVPSRALTIQEEKRLNLRLNKNTGDWDYEKLGDKFDTETLLDVGFDNEDLSKIWDESEVKDDSKKVKEIIENVKHTSVVKGDIYQMGNHRLMCGDSTDIEDVKKLCGENKINMVYCDPPYNIGLDYKGGLSGNDKYKGTEGEQLDDSKTDESYSDFIQKSLQGALEVCEDDVHLFYWCDERFIWMFQLLFKQNGIDNKRVCLWIKNNFNATPQLAFNKVYEPCVYGVIGRPYINPKFMNFHEILNREISTGNRVFDEVNDWFNMWIVKRDSTQNYKHPTQKPTTLHEKPIKRTTKVNDNILDLFGGSGSTLMASEQLGRKSFLMEMDPIFCQVIITRWEDFTGKKAEKINK